jgi:hypothetical protein
MARSRTSTCPRITTQGRPLKRQGSSQRCAQPRPPQSLLPPGPDPAALRATRAGRTLGGGRSSASQLTASLHLRSEPRGIGFIEFADKRDAEDCLEAMNGTTINGRTVSAWAAAGRQQLGAAGSSWEQQQARVCGCRAAAVPLRRCGRGSLCAPARLAPHGRIHSRLGTCVLMPRCRPAAAADRHERGAQGAQEARGVQGWAPARPWACCPGCPGCTGERCAAASLAGEPWAEQRWAPQVATGTAAMTTGAATSGATSGAAMNAAAATTGTGGKTTGGATTGAIATATTGASGTATAGASGTGGLTSVTSGGRRRRGCWRAALASCAGVRRQLRVGLAAGAAVQAAGRARLRAGEGQGQGQGEAGPQQEQEQEQGPQAQRREVGGLARPGCCGCRRGPASAAHTPRLPTAGAAPWLLPLPRPRPQPPAPHTLTQSRAPPTAAGPSAAPDRPPGGRAAPPDRPPGGRAAPPAAARAAPPAAAALPTAPPAATRAAPPALPGPPGTRRPQLPAVRPRHRKGLPTEDSLPAAHASQMPLVCRGTPTYTLQLALMKQGKVGRCSPRSSSVHALSPCVLQYAADR